MCTQRIGDVLLATPLAHSVKAAWPEAQLDFLVLPGTQGVLEGNPDVNQV
ncbi:MAG: LPS core biosynthesis protein, partial [Deltaproteobacteria bacterium HGW-Deltaproteobacteria-20]